MIYVLIYNKLLYYLNLIKINIKSFLTCYIVTILIKFDYLKVL